MPLIAKLKAAFLATFTLVLTGILAVDEKIIAAFFAVRSATAKSVVTVRKSVTTKFAALITVILMTSSLSSCSSLAYFGDNYSGIESVKFEHDDRGWLIFDNPEKNRLIIISSWRFLGLGHTPPVYRDAAIAYLDSQGKECKATNYHEIQGITEFEWEVEYSCSGD